ncbi:hypothetical protein, partial [Bacillus paranthracis]|uniref:hypothetical protein n=1 Tax=Bacillus paranthracis TaxID=2026186 RepID=UPI0021D0C64E
DDIETEYSLVYVIFFIVLHNQKFFHLFLEDITFCSIFPYRLNNCLISVILDVTQYENSAEKIPIRTPVTPSKG